jgi:hypothetical protein
MYQATLVIIEYIHICLTSCRIMQYDGLYKVDCHGRYELCLVRLSHEVLQDSSRIVSMFEQLNPAASRSPDICLSVNVF